ncbi:MAG: peptide chain release factor 2 [Dehalococcoidales bacterium]|nr:peptide chain release factor 2 [Dehalococcoidales bacterium]MDP6737663.1 peptide chain release factor 2 [Dehalococcoidales bacterium]
MREQLQDLRVRISSVMVRLDITAREEEITKLENRSVQPNFWVDPTEAQNTMRRLAEVRKLVGKWRNLESKIAEITEDLILAEEEPSLITEIKPRITESATHLDEMELEIAFSGEYDDRDALLSIHAGAGGTESQDWAEMLLRMYLHWAERRGYQSEILETTPGEETGLKSVTIEVSGDYAFGYLKSEHGVHRLVRLSPFDSDHARHTSFALVEIMPEAEDDMAVQIRTEDLKMDMFRSSGAGGQNVQKTSTAVRLTHLPTGLTVTCQNERSQYQNREIALKILQARLLEAEVARKAEERAKLKGKRVEAGWGNQVRSYVLHPYKMVKDHRTDYQTGNTEAVLSGELDGFITAYLRSLVGKEKG